MSENPYEALGSTAWIKGMRLGMLILFLFLGGALGAFALLTLMGLSAGNSLITAAILGPVIGTGGFILWWLLKKPRLVE